MPRSSIPRKVLHAAVIVTGLFMNGIAVAADDHWQGFSVLNGGKGYASTPMGQVHFRDLGPRDAKHVVLLMHQTPMSMIEFGGIQNALAKLGMRAIAIDTPGYGMSDHPKGWPSVADFADNIVPVIDHLKVQKVIIGGHHTGASIAASFAARHGNRVAGIVLHGTPVFTPEEQEKWKKQAPFEAPVEMQPDGSHLAKLFRSGKPASDEPPPSLSGPTWMTITMFMQSHDIGHPAAFDYAMEPDLMAIKAPGLIMTDVHDVIYDLDLRAAKMRPDFKFVEFSKGGTDQLMIEPGRYAKVLADWAAALK